MAAMAQRQIIGEIAARRHRSRRRPAGNMLLRLAAFLTVAVLCAPACAEEGEPRMRTAELVGVPIRAVNYANSHGVLTRSPEGRDGMFYIGYYSTTGSELVGYHAASGEQVRISLEAHGGYGACVGPEGEIYVGGHWPGDVYRYDPATGEVANLGGSQHGAEYIWDLVLSDDGKVYGGTYPTCSVLEYDIASGQLRDLGPLDAERKYVISLCLDSLGQIWAGVGCPPQLWVIDPDSGEREQVLPEQYCDGGGTCHGVLASGDYVVASAETDGGLLVFDARTRQIVRHLPHERSSWVLCRGGRAGQQYLYDHLSGDFYRYDIEADEATLLAPGLGQCEQVVDDRFVHGIADQDYFLYDLERGEYVVRGITLAEARDGMRIQTLTGHPAGLIFGSTYINQHMFGYRPASGRITDLGKVVRTDGQVDSIHTGSDGRIYMGSYPGVHLSIYDPSLPWRPGLEPDSNPRELGALGHGQVRVRAIALGPDNRIWVGSIPDYASAPTGAFSVWDPQTGEHRSWDDLVPDGAVRRIGVGERYLYCAGGGRFFVWDPVAEEKVYEADLPTSSLAVAPGGTVVVSAGEELALFDAERLEFVRTMPSPIGAMTHMICAPDGNVYGINEDAAAMVEPGTWQATQIAEEGGVFLAADADSTLYFARGSELWRLK